MFDFPEVYKDRPEKLNPKFRVIFRKLFWLYDILRTITKNVIELFGMLSQGVFLAKSPFNFS